MSAAGITYICREGADIDHAKYDTVLVHYDEFQDMHLAPGPPRNTLSDADLGGKGEDHAYIGILSDPSEPHKHKPVQVVEGRYFGKPRVSANEAGL
jgi:hypothetical protein